MIDFQDGINHTHIGSLSNLSVSNLWIRAKNLVAYYEHTPDTASDSRLVRMDLEKTVSEVLAAGDLISRV